MKFDAARALATVHELGDPRFAGPDGELPVDFDGLVRESFGELVGAW